MSLIARAKQQNKINERELKLGYTSGVSSWHKQYSDSAWIYAGGLNYDLTEGDLLAVFSQYGEILNINLVRDQKTGKSKGFCFICYEDQRSTVLATDNLNGITLCGRIIKVDHVEKYKVPKDSMLDVSKEKSEAKNIDITNKDEVAEYVRKHGCGPEVFRELEELSKQAHTKEGEKEKSKKSKKSKKDKKKKKKKAKKNKKKKNTKTKEDSYSPQTVPSSESSQNSSDSENDVKNDIKVDSEDIDGQVIDRNPEPPITYEIFNKKSDPLTVAEYNHGLPKSSPPRNPVIRTAAPIKYANAEPPSPPRRQFFRRQEPRINTYQSENRTSHSHYRDRSSPRRSNNFRQEHFNQSPRNRSLRRSPKERNSPRSFRSPHRRR